VIIEAGCDFDAEADLNQTIGNVIECAVSTRMNDDPYIGIQRAIQEGKRELPYLAPLEFMKRVFRRMNNG
jgi:hypothetical protein